MPISQQPETGPTEKPSKSALKRRYTELQDLGEKLVGLSADQLASLPLEPALLQAVTDASRITSNSALRRQRQLIGKLMRYADADAIREGFEAFGAQERNDKRIFKDAEKWRDRISNEGINAMQLFVELTGCDEQEIRSLYQQYNNELSDKTRKVLRRKLFKEIHKQLDIAFQKSAGK